MTIKEWLDIIVRILPYLMTIIGFVIVTWANSNYVSKKALREMLDQELHAIKTDISLVRSDVEKQKQFYSEFGIFKEQYRGDTNLRNEQMKNLNDVLKNISEEVKSVNTKVSNL